MNKQRLLELADWLGKGAKHEHVRFNMSTFMTFKLKDWYAPITKDNICGTVCCIAGCAVQFFAPENCADLTNQELCRPNLVDYKGIAARVLGLGTEQAEALFFPDRQLISDYSQITPQWAAKVIRHMVETGHVDWMAFAPAEFFEQ